MPNPALKELADRLSAPPPNVEIQIGDLPQALAQADVAIASTGTVTMECAFFGVPTVTLYKTSWFTYEIARRIVTVKSLTMPNLLADEEVYPEFIQNAATPENIAGAALELLQNESRRQKIKSQLAKIISSLGEPGAAERAAAAILSLFQHRQASRLSQCHLSDFVIQARRRSSNDWIMKDLTSPTWIKLKDCCSCSSGLPRPFCFFSTVRIGRLPFCSWWRSGVSAGFTISHSTSSKNTLTRAYKFSGLISFARYLFRRR